MIPKKKPIKKRHDGTVSFSSGEITAAKCQDIVTASNAHVTSSTDDKADVVGKVVDAKKKRSRFLVMSVVDKRRQSVDDCPKESSDQKDATFTISENDDTSVRDRRVNDILEYTKFSSLNESRSRVNHSERSRKLSSVVQPRDPLSRTEEMREPHSESYVMQPVFYCQSPLLHVSPGQIIPINLLSENPRRTVSQCLFPVEIKDRLSQIRDRSAPSPRSARLYEKYNVGLAAAKENLRRYCLSRLSESRSFESAKPLGALRNLSNQINSVGKVRQNEATCATLGTGIAFANEDKLPTSIQHCATIVEDPRPEEAVVSIPSDSVAVPCESTTEQQPQLVKTSVPLGQMQSHHQPQQPQPQQQQQQKLMAIPDKQKAMLNRRRQSDLGSIAMMQRKIKVNGSIDVINFDDLRERLEQLTGTTCCSVGSTNSGPGAAASNGSKNKKNAITEKSNGLAKLGHLVSRTKLNSQGEPGPLFTGRNQRHNSIAVVENQEARRLLDLGQSVSDLTQPHDVVSRKPSPTGKEKPLTTSSHFHHSQSTMALSSLVSASTQTSSDAIVNSTLRRHSNYDFHPIAPISTQVVPEVGTLGGSRLDDSLSLDDVVSLIQAGEALYDVSTEESFWRQLSEGFESGRFQVVCKEESNEESLFECTYDDEMDGVAVVMVEDAKTVSPTTGDHFQQTLVRQKTEREATRKRQARERYELHRWYVRHGRPPPRMSLESIYFSSFYRKDTNQNKPIESSAGDTSSANLGILAETDSVADTTHEDPATNETATGKAVPPELSLGAVEAHEPIGVLRPAGEIDSKSVPQHSFSSEDDNYNSIDKHFNTGDEAANCQGLKPPKSPWEIAYNKRAEQLAYLQSLQQQLKNERRQHEGGTLPALDSLPESLVCQLQQLLNKRQQIMHLTRMLHQEQHFQQHQQQVKFVEQQVSEFLKCQSHQTVSLQSNPISKQPRPSLDMLYNLQRQFPTTTCDASLQQRINEMISSHKPFSDSNQKLPDTPCQFALPGVVGKNFASNRSYLTPKPPNVNFMCDFLANINYFQKSQQDISLPCSYKMVNAHPAKHQSPFQPSIRCEESLFQPIKAPPGNLLHTLANHFEKVAADIQSTQDRLELPKCYQPHPPQTCGSNKNPECQYQYPSMSSFVPDPQDQQNQQMYFAQQQNLLEQQIALLKLLQNPSLEPHLLHSTNNTVTPRNISKMDVTKNLMDNTPTNEHKFVSNPSNLPLNNVECILEEQIQALLSSISASFKS